ncbi:hypothetical protein ALC56_12925, partial [Trachymyrmex septentrionalis]
HEGASPRVFVKRDDAGGGGANRGGGGGDGGGGGGDGDGPGSSTRTSLFSSRNRRIQCRRRRAIPNDYPICSMHPCFEEIVPNHDAGNHLATTVGAEMNRKGMRFLYFDTPFCTLIRSEDENFAADSRLLRHRFSYIYEQPLTGVEHSQWDIGHRGIVSYLSFGRVTSNSPGGPGGLVSGFIRTRSWFDDDRRLLTLIKRSAWKWSEQRWFFSRLYNNNIPNYIMTVRRKNNFVHERRVTAKFLESLSRLKTVYPTKFMNEIVNNILFIVKVYLKCNSFIFILPYTSIERG